MGAREHALLNEKKRRRVYLNLLYAPILKILVPQTGQIPFIAGLPFFMVIFCGFFISRLVRHLTQYAWTIQSTPEYRHYAVYICSHKTVPDRGLMRH